MFGSKAFFTALVLLHVVQFSDGKTWWKRHDGFCNRKSSKCGTECNVNSDCPHGECWRDKDVCGTSSGYCNAASSNCGARCNTVNDCPDGDCWKKMEDCGGTNTGDHIVGTYLGMLLGRKWAPLLFFVIHLCNLLFNFVGHWPKYRHQFRLQIGSSFCQLSLELDIYLPFSS